MVRRQSQHLLTNLKNTNEMRKELGYFVSIVSIFLLSIYLLLGIFRRYVAFTIDHWWSTCTTFTSDFFMKADHYLGLFLIVLVFVVFAGLFLRALFSFIKTKKRLETILQKRIFRISRKLDVILEKNHIQRDMVTVVESSDDCALTIGWFFPRIIVSSNIINGLSGKQLEAVILHELYHAKNKHPLLLITSEILSSSLRMLPILKEIAAKMRTVLEKEADKFVVERQGTSRYLDLALEKVNLQNGFKLYPAFSRRNDYKFNKVNFATSLLVFLAMVLLFSSPIDPHMINAKGDLRLSNCREDICFTHCLKDDIYWGFGTAPDFWLTAHTPFAY